MKKFIIILTVIFSLNVVYPVNGKEIVKTKSKTTALMWSLGSTATSIAGGIALISYNSPTEVSTFKRKVLPDIGYSLLLYGAYIGPTTGHFYANQWRRGFISMGIRIGITGGLSLIALNLSPRGEGLEAPLWFTGAALILLIDVIDIFSAPLSVHKYNESIIKSGGIYTQPKIELGNNSYGLNIVFNF